eukprot:652627-Amphidinium_carterae.1
MAVTTPSSMPLRVSAPSPRFASAAPPPLQPPGSRQVLRSHQKGLSRNMWLQHVSTAIHEDVRCGTCLAPAPVWAQPLQQSRAPPFCVSPCACGSAVEAYHSTKSVSHAKGAPSPQPPPSSQPEEAEVHPHVRSHLRMSCSYAKRAAADLTRTAADLFHHRSHPLHHHQLSQALPRAITTIYVHAGVLHEALSLVICPTSELQSAGD